MSIQLGHFTERECQICIFFDFTYLVAVLKNKEAVRLKKDKYQPD